MNVLLGLAGTDESIRALRRTIERTREAGDQLTVAIVDRNDAKRTPEEMYEEAAAILEDADVDAEVRRLEGDPGSALVDLAEREDFDQLVIGGGTESPMGKIRLGPVTEFVLLNATTTVTLVR